MFGVLEETVMAAIETAGTPIEDWENQFSEDLLWGPLPEMSPQLPPESDEAGEGPVSKEQTSHFLQIAGAFSGDHEPATRPPFLGNQSDAAQEPSISAQTPLEEHPPKGQPAQLNEVGFFVARSILPLIFM